MPDRISSLRHDGVRAVAHLRRPIEAAVVTLAVADDDVSRLPIRQRVG